MNVARFLAPALLLALASGCFNPDVKKEEKKPEKTEGGRKVAMENQFGLAGDLDDLAKRKGAQNGQPLNRPKAREHSVAGSAGNVGVMTNQLYNYQEIIKKRPDLKVLSKSTTGNIVTTSYYSPVSRHAIGIFKHNMDIWKLTNNRTPTFKEVIAKPREFTTDLPKLPLWQVWAYDEKTGELRILEDPKKRTQIEGK